MNKIAVSVAAITRLVASYAFAADMAVKAPAPAPAPVYNWTGWYVGVNAGASMGKVNTDFNTAPLFGTRGGLPQFTSGLGFTDISAPDGFIGGGQIGYNWQYSPLIVVGFEADIQGALERDTFNSLGPSFNFVLGGGNGRACGASVKGSSGHVQ